MNPAVRFSTFSFSFFRRRLHSIRSFELQQWLTAEIKLAWQIKEFLHPLFRFFVHCLQQQRTTAAMNRIQ